ncbi:MAG: hypothetical protein MASP_00228 [Candidatus Methanolliviera sp. GoM_asphalt]|nr:MAG: hypothetical protein MASP_00228 [Candidatus Methanolliviera sp. GoM_asphalt]
MEDTLGKKFNIEDLLKNSKGYHDKFFWYK